MFGYSFLGLWKGFTIGQEGYLKGSLFLPDCGTSTAHSSDDFKSISLLKRTSYITFSAAEKGHETPEVSWPRDSQHHKTRLGKVFILTSWEVY